MSVTVRIPSALRNFTNKQGEVVVEGATVLEALNDLSARHNAIRHHIFDDTNTVRSFITLFLGDVDIKELNGFDTPLDNGAVLTLVPAIAGGR
ncbi:MAG: MoaD/ThiS family protein [Helicobacteraceae bacterium]|jgi:molybdopterin converting factor small subunit|nr:MoaD/ThiS family protein [Helicobacteraceae bacterium]